MPSALQHELAQTGILKETQDVHRKLTVAVQTALEDGYTIDQILDAFTIRGSEEFADFVAMTIDDIMLAESSRMGHKKPKRLSPAARARRLAGNKSFIGR